MALNLEYLQRNSKVTTKKKISFKPTKVKNLVLIDSRIDNPNVLLKGVKDGYDHVLVGSNDDLVSIISNNTSEHFTYNLSFVCHGEPGKLIIGADVIDSNFVINNQNIFNNIYIENIYLFSCFVGKDRNFINTFSDITNSQIFFSTSKVGHTSRNG